MNVSKKKHCKDDRIVKSGAHVVLVLVQLLLWRFWRVRLGNVFRPRERFCNVASEPADAEPQVSSEGSEAARSGVIGKTVLEGRRQQCEQKRASAKSKGVDLGLEKKTKERKLLLRGRVQRDDQWV